MPSYIPKCQAQLWSKISSDPRMEVRYPQEKVFDLSSGQTVPGGIKHLCSYMESLSGPGSGSASDRSHTANVHSVSISFQSAAYILPDTAEQLATPIINSLTSAPASPGFLASNSLQMIHSPAAPTPTEEVTTSYSSVRILPTQLRHRKSLRRKDSSDEIMSQCSQWDNYRNSMEGSAAAESLISRESSVRRTTSIKRSDFTNRAELLQFKKDRKFLFHKGFFRRHQTRYAKFSNKKFSRNKADLNAVLNFIDLSSIKVEDALPYDSVTVYEPRKLLSVYPRIAKAFEVPLREYPRTFSRENSIKRTLPPGLLLNHSTRRSYTSPRRSNTTPPAIRHIRSRSYSPQNRIIHDLWAEYMKLVVFQRVQLRLSLSSPDRRGEQNTEGIEVHSFTSALSESQEPLELQYTWNRPSSEGLKLGFEADHPKSHQIYPISSFEECHSTTSLRTTSSNTVSAMRKAY